MSDRGIREALERLLGLHKVDQVCYINVTVSSVDITKRICSCTAIDGHTEYELPTVKLMAVVDDGILFEPVIGSTVKVIFSQNIEPFVCQYSEIENITLDAKTLIKLNDGSFGGLLKIKETVDRLNAVEKDLNSLKTAFSSWIVIPSDGGAALKTVTAKWMADRIKETKISDLENIKIKHGK
jgi:hypothetical protein